MEGGTGDHTGTLHGVTDKQSDQGSNADRIAPVASIIANSWMMDEIVPEG